MKGFSFNPRARSRVLSSSLPDADQPPEAWAGWSPGAPPTSLRGWPRVACRSWCSRWSAGTARSPPTQQRRIHQSIAPGVDLPAGRPGRAARHRVRNPEGAGGARLVFDHPGRPWRGRPAGGAGRGDWLWRGRIDRTVRRRARRAGEGGVGWWLLSAARTRVGGTAVSECVGFAGGIWGRRDCLARGAARAGGRGRRRPGSSRRRAARVRPGRPAQCVGRNDRTAGRAGCAGGMGAHPRAGGREICRPVHAGDSRRNAHRLRPGRGARRHLPVTSVFPSCRPAPRRRYRAGP